MSQSKPPTILSSHDLADTAGPPRARAQAAEQLLDVARQTFRIEAQAIARLNQRLDHRFIEALRALRDAPGRVAVAGMGKSGLIGRKISATLSSTGTPSFFLHPADALHGDLGMLTGDDVVLAISNSGETAEVLALVPFALQRCQRLIAMVGAPGSSLARAAQVVLDVSVEEEAGPLALGPTASAVAALAMGHALALTLMYERATAAEDVAAVHPGGYLGERLMRLAGGTRPLPAAPRDDLAQSDS